MIKRKRAIRVVDVLHSWVHARALPRPQRKKPAPLWVTRGEAPDDVLLEPIPRKAVRSAPGGAEPVESVVVPGRSDRALARKRPLVSLLVVLIMGLTGVVSSSQYHGAAQSSVAWLELLSWLPVIVTGAVLGAAMAAINGLVLHRSDIHDAWSVPPQNRWLALHFALAVVLFLAAYTLPALIEVNASLSWYGLAYYLFSPVLWLAYLLTGSAILLPGFSQMAQTHRRRTVAIVALVLLAYAGWRLFERLGYPDSTVFTQASMALASGISGGLGHPIQLAVIKSDGTPVYHAGTFSAFIFPGCSGLEGMALTVALLLTMLWLERRNLYLWRASALVVAAAGVAFVLNALRLAVLFYIGDKWSSDIAENGFHANFGVVALILVVCGFATAIRRIADRRQPIDVGMPIVIAERLERPDVRLIYPTMAIIGASLLFGMVTGAFNWAYPAPMVIGLWLLWRLRLPPVEADWSMTVLPVAAGFVVFHLWTAMIAPDPAASQQYSDTLVGASPLISVPWLAARLMGSILVVPITEELTFRGFLLPWLSDRLAGVLPWYGRQALAFATTAIGFGLMHAQIGAGMMAGLCFGLVYLRRRSVRDAILAHATTNVLLCAYAVGWAQWSYL